MMEYAIKWLKANGYNKTKDLVFLLIDVDNETKRKEIIRENLMSKAKKKKLTFIFSNPCFELWFLNHFTFTSKQYSNQNELINDLRKFIPNYSKSLDFFDLLIDKIEIGKANSIKQVKDKINEVPKSPGTLVFELVGL